MAEDQLLLAAFILSSWISRWPCLKQPLVIKLTGIIMYLKPSLIIAHVAFYLAQISAVFVRQIAM
jgi:hypothetical protein